MSSRLPEFVDPWRLADQGKLFSGVVELKNLPRLRETLMSEQGSAEFELRFERSDQRRVRIRGSVTATLVLECQRCLERLNYPVETSVNLAVIEVLEEVGRLPAECEPLLAEEGRIRLMDLVEDELLLSIPQVPRHDPSECGTDIETFATVTGAEQERADKTPETSPFAVLARLKPNEQK